MKYLIGIDSGGTSTKAAIYSVDGELINQVITGDSNFLVDMKRAKANVVNSVLQLLEHVKVTKCELILLGGAGIDSGDAAFEMESELSRFSEKIVVINDAWMAHLALLKGRDGLLVVSGTGSITIGLNNGVKSRVGGWGHLLGDEGSAYSISINYMKNLLNKTDGGENLSDFELDFLSKINTKNVFEMVKYAHHSTKSEIAVLAELISINSNKGDECAIRVLKNAGKELADLIKCLLRKQSFSSSVDIAVAGSVLINNDYVYDSLKKELHSYCNDHEINLIRKSVSHTISAYYLYESLKENQ